MDFTVREYGLQIDQPPAIGNLSSLMVIIQKNDNAEGILEFDPKYVNITGTFIPLSLFFSCFVIYYFFYDLFYWRESSCAYKFTGKLLAIIFMIWTLMINGQY